MKKYILYTLMTSTSIFLLAACQNTNPVAVDDNHVLAEEDDHAHSEEEVTLNVLQMKNIGLKVGGMENRNLSNVIRSNGVLDLPPDQQAAVSSRLAGNIQNIHVHFGDEVKKGQILAYIEAPDLIKKQETYQKNKADIIYLQKELERKKELVKLQSAAQKELEQVASQLEVKLAEQQSLEAQFQLLNFNPPTGEKPFTSLLPVRSPISGMVQIVHKNLGEYVEPNVPMFVIVDNRHLHADIQLFEKDLPHIKKDQEAEFFLQSNPSDIHKVSIFAIGRVMDENTRTVSLHAEVNNPDKKLLPGMYIEVRIPIGKETVACLPTDAVTTDKGLNYIFVEEHKHGYETTFKKVQVIAGISDGGYIAVKPMETIEADAQIVTEGAFFLLAESKKGEEEAGHHH